MSVAIVLFTRDLGGHDHAALTAATMEYERMVPLFVLDEALLRDGTPNRVLFLLESLCDWRVDAHAFAGLLVDADVASNVGNWQWAEPWRAPLALVAPDCPAPLARVA